MLWDVCQDSATIVPVLMGVLADANQASMHLWSIALLGETGPASSNAVPLLEAKAREDAEYRDGAQKEYEEGIRNTAKEALKKIEATKAGLK